MLTSLRCADAFASSLSLFLRTRTISETREKRVSNNNNKGRNDNSRSAPCCPTRIDSSTCGPPCSGSRSACGGCGGVCVSARVIFTHLNPSQLIFFLAAFVYEIGALYSLPQLIFPFHGPRSPICGLRRRLENDGTHLLLARFSLLMRASSASALSRFSRVAVSTISTTFCAATRPTNQQPPREEITSRQDKINRDARQHPTQKKSLAGDICWLLSTRSGGSSAWSSLGGWGEVR